MATTAEIAGQINQRAAHMSLVAGYLTVVLLLVLAASWRHIVEPQVPGSTAAGVVSHGLTAAAGALMLGYGWKGASAIYHANGMDAGTFDQTGLYVNYILNDVGSCIGWLGVTVAAGAIAWRGCASGRCRSGSALSHACRSWRWSGSRAGPVFLASRAWSRRSG